MRTKAKVIRTEGNVAWVRVCHGEYCAGCGLHSADEKLIDVAVRNMLKVRAGDRVEVTSDEGQMVRTMFLVFWFPLGMAALLAWIGYEISVRLAWKEPPVLSIALGLVGFAAALLTVYRVGKRTQAGTGLTISRVILDEGITSCSSGLPLEGNPPVP
jgi:positive regulator of sigma E activity